MEKVNLLDITIEINGGYNYNEKEDKIFDITTTIIQSI
jgi:hypothetical protein